MNYCKYCMDPLRNGEISCLKCASLSAKSVPAHRLLPGTLLNGRYRVGKVLGEGGFGITYIGRDMKLDMKVAVKEYYPNGLVNRNNTFSPTVNCSVSDDKEIFFVNGRKKFIQEARILAKFSGEKGIVEVRDFFECNNTAYIIMEYLEGRDLKEHLKINGVLPVEKAVQTLVPVMRTLSEIHKHGLIHRDISPDNIRLTPNGVKLLDFGAAREMTTQINRSISVMLKPGYAPEEQYRSKGIQGPWTDVYAVCATLYKCITGVTPDDAAQRSYSDELQKPSLLGVRINPATESVIMKGMSVLQQNRYQTMDELLNALLASMNSVITKSGAVTSGPDPVVMNPEKTVHIGIQNAANILHSSPSSPPSENEVQRVSQHSYQPSAPQPPVPNPPAPNSYIQHSPVQQTNPESDSKTKKIIAAVIIGIIAVFMLALAAGVAIKLIGNKESGNLNSPEQNTGYYENEPAYPPSSEITDVSKQLIENIFNFELSASCSLEILDWEKTESAINQYVLDAVNTSSIENAYAAISANEQKDIRNADDLLKSGIDIAEYYREIYGDNIEISYGDFQTAYINESDVSPYIRNLQSKLDSFSEYGITADSVDFDSIEQYAKAEFSVTYSGSEAYNTCSYFTIWGFINGEWKVVYFEEDGDPLYLYSVTFLETLISEK